MLSRVNIFWLTVILVSVIYQTFGQTSLNSPTSNIISDDDETNTTSVTTVSEAITATVDKNKTSETSKVFSSAETITTSTITTTKNATTESQPTTTATPTSGQITNLTIADVGDYLKINWSSIGFNSTGYKVYFSCTRAAASNCYQLYNTTSENLIVSKEDLTDGQTYMITVGDELSKSQNSTVQSFTKAPSPPSGLSCLLTYKSITYSWTLGKGVNDGWMYLFQGKNDGGEPQNGTIMSRTGETHFNRSFEELRPSTSYTFAIRAFSSSAFSQGEHIYSGWLNITNITTEGVPDKVQNLTFHTYEDRIKVEWGEPAKTNGIIIGYILTLEDLTNTKSRKVLGLSCNDSTMPGATVNPPDLEDAKKIVDGIYCRKLSYEIEELEESTNYTFHIYAVTGGGNGESFKTTVNTKPAPAEIDENSIRKSRNWIWLSMKRRKNVATFFLTYKSSQETKMIQKFDQSSLNLTELTPCVEYNISITTVDIWNNTAESAPIHVRTGPHIPPRKVIRQAYRKDLIDTAEIQKSKITFSFMINMTEVFDTSCGNVESYQFFAVASETENGAFQREGTDDAEVGTWASSKKGLFKEPYAFDDRIMVESRNSGQRQRVVIGSDGSCDKDVISKICDGPLEPSTSYCAFLRGWTGGGFQDSECLIIVKTAEDNTGVIVACVVAGAIILICVLISIFIYKLRKDKILSYFSRKPKYEKHNMDERRTDIVDLPPDIPIKDFKQHVMNLHKDQDRGFSAEYSRIRELSPNHSQNDALLSCNTEKNRYTDVLPFDHSRVKLLEAEDDEGSDYINASYIPGYNSKREYIAAQGPLPSTVSDFWRMIWEQNVSIIIMLTQCIEKGRVICVQYWPECVNDKTDYDTIEVGLRKEEGLAEYTIREFDVKKGDLTRVVKQFYVSFWLDKKAPPSPDSLITLISTLRSEIRPENPGPILVHCSAGVGRTGTYIAVDHLIQHIKDHSEINIFKVVFDLRRNRCQMVQTESQYIYLHDCISHEVEKKMAASYPETNVTFQSETDTVDLLVKEEELKQNLTTAL